MPGALALQCSPPCPAGPPAGGAGNVIFRAVGQNREFCIISTGSRLLCPLGCSPKRVRKTGPRGAGPFSPIPARRRAFKSIGRAQALFSHFPLGQGRKARLHLSQLKKFCAAHFKYFSAYPASALPSTSF